MQLSDHSNGSLEKEKDEEGDVIELDDDEDMEEDEGEIDTETNTVTTTISPKKKSHPMKGKNLIGKYDVEDPFIDDSELLWEEQRAATKDGFFVYFGPLIEKGHYASLERANGTMKRGGVKNK
ncbi:BFH_collapsed_G0003990.mRNA.1.CDS.1 [Saccharomyces cerevisiae]|nr:BFH_collapsed_G0003990.mRNA.1.CDS.1 [Saccharomyces cerevisiae]